MTHFHKWSYTAISGKKSCNSKMRRFALTAINFDLTEMSHFLVIRQNIYTVFFRWIILVIALARSSLYPVFLFHSATVGMTHSFRVIENYTNVRYCVIFPNAIGIGLARNEDLKIIIFCHLPSVSYPRPFSGFSISKLLSRRILNSAILTKV